MLTFICSLISCNSQKKLQTTNLPFSVDQSYVQSWAGGRAESGSGVDLKINLEAALHNMTVEKVYFRGRALDCKMLIENNKTIISSSYKTDSTTRNKADKAGTKMKKKFELNGDEAIISYRDAKTNLRYMKVENIKEKTPILYKSKPRQ